MPDNPRMPSSLRRLIRSADVRIQREHDVGVGGRERGGALIGQAGERSLAATRDLQRDQPPDGAIIGADRLDRGAQAPIELLDAGGVAQIEIGVGDVDLRRRGFGLRDRGRGGGEKGDGCDDLQHGSIPLLA